MRSRGKPRAALQQRRWRTCHDLHHTAKTLGLTGPHALSAAPTKGSSRSSPMSAIGPKRTSIGPGHCTVDWQRNGREEYVIGIIMPLGVDEPFGIGTVGLHRAIVTRSEKVRIGTGKRHRFKALTCSANPTLMLPLLEFVRTVDEASQNFDKYVIATQAERRCLLRHSRGGAFELMGKDRTAGRDRHLHRSNEDVDASAIERGQPTSVHNFALPIDEIWVENGQRPSIGRHVNGASEQRPKLEEWCQPRFTLRRRTAPGWYDHNHGSVRADSDSNLNRQLIRQESFNLGAALQNSLGLRKWIYKNTGADIRTSCRRWYIVVTTRKFPPPPRNAQKSSLSLSSRASATRPSARTTSAASKLSRARPKRPISGP